MPKVHYDRLLNFCNQLLAGGGMAPADAKLVATLLVRAEARGYAGHGVIRVPPYLAWIKDGTYQIAERPKVEREGNVTATVDGKHYIGQVAAHFAMELAIRKAKEHGVGLVSLKRAGHTGRLADFMEMAADEGLIAMGAVSVGSPSTTLYGGRQAITGTNPMAFGIPARNGESIILDFATAAMSMGEIQKRVSRQEAIPEGVMLDGHGRPTTDFDAFRGPPRGVFLPFGGYKGSGIALVTELLGGILTGNGLGRHWAKRGGHGVNGVFLQAFAVEEFQDLATFYDGVDELRAAIKATPRAPGFDDIYLPGEAGRKKEAEQRQRGVEVHDKTWRQLLQLAAALGVQDIPES